MNFDGIAPWYQWMEYLGLGRALERRRAEFLADFAAGSSVRKVLLLGDGDGRFLAALLATNPALEADTVDSSAGMLRLARRRVGPSVTPNFPDTKIRFHHADALTWLPAPGCTYDAVMTHFFLDCLTEPQIDLLLARLRPFLAPDALWIVSEFNQPLHGWKAWRSRLWINGLYRLFRWATGLKTRQLPDYRACLERCEFRLEKQVIVNQGLLVSDRWCRAEVIGSSQK